MKGSLLVVLAACVAVALGSPVGLAVGKLVSATPAQTLMIDVTSDFVDSQQTQHIFQVAVGVQVMQGNIFLNGLRVGSGAPNAYQTTVEISAQFREVASNGEVVNAHNVKVSLQAAVQAQLSNGLMQSLSIQLLLSEVDGSLLTQVAVHEVIVFVDAVGAETGRQVQTMPLPQSRITTAAPTAAPATTAEPATGTGYLATSEPTTQDSSDSSDESHDEQNFEHREKCRVRRFFNWVHKQSFGVRVLIYAIMVVLFVLTMKFLFCLVTVCCCSRPKSRTTYLNNVKLHYVPLSLDDDDEKKPMLI